MEHVRKDEAMAEVVRVFFKYFTTAIIEGNKKGDKQDDMLIFEPRNIKMMMLNHYEDISRVFNQEAFYAFSRMNYEEHEVDSLLRPAIDAINNGAGNNNDMQNDDGPAMDEESMKAIKMVRLACRTEDFFNAMVEEYKRNFTLLLCGRIATQQEHDESRTVNDSLGTMQAQQAISIINNMASNAYKKGKEM